MIAVNIAIATLSTHRGPKTRQSAAFTCRIELEVTFPKDILDTEHTDRLEPKMIVLYARVSTSNQTLERQVTVARNAGFEIDEVISDHG